MRRAIEVGSLLTVLLPVAIGAPSAFAQGSYRHHAWCLQTGSGMECAYDTLAQCREAGSGATLGGCVRNTSTMNHR